MNSISIPSDTHHKREPMPAPSAVISRMPVVVRDRMPHVQMPVEYEAACKALATCVTLDEGKYWSDKADALAAWAKIYKNDEAAIAALRLKLQAFRRMWALSEALEAERVEAERLRLEAERPLLIEQLTEEWREAKGKGDRKAARAALSARARLRHGAPMRGGNNKELLPQPTNRLVAAGLSRPQATLAASVGRLPESTFKSAVAVGASVSAAAALSRGSGQRKDIFSAAYLWVSSANDGPLLSVAFKRTSQRRPGDVAAGLSQKEANELRPRVRELIEWLDAFEQALPKAQ